MVPAVNLAQARRAHVRVDLGRADVRVTEKGLHDAQVGAPVEEMRREGVAQRVGRHAFAHPGGERAAADELPDRLAGERSPAHAEEDEGARAAAEETGSLAREVRLEGGPGRSTDGHDAFL